MPQLQNDKDSGLDYAIVGGGTSPKHIVVMLHGSGADYADMEMAAKFFEKKMPDTAFLVPNAPFRFVDILPPEQAAQIKAAGMDEDKMRSWFDAAKIESLTEGQAFRALKEKMRETAERLNTFIDSQLAKYGLGSKDLAVYGFSQGGVLSLQSSMERFDPAAAIISHSGYLIDDSYAFAKSRTLLIVGEQELGAGLPMADMHPATLDILREAGVPATEYVAKGLGHSINMDTVNTASAFMNKAFAGPTQEAINGLSATFAKFAGQEVPVHELFKELPDGTRESIHVKPLDTNGDQMKEFRAAAVEAGFRDIRIVTPTTQIRKADHVADRLSAKIERGADGKYRFSSFNPG